MSAGTPFPGETHRFVCADGFEAMMSCVYEAWRWENRGFTVELAVGAGEENYRLFCTEHEVETDGERAEKVIRSVRKNLSAKVLRLVYTASLSDAPEKLEVIYRFLRLCFGRGREIADCLTEEPVMRIRELDRRVTNESHKYREFVRFTRGEDGILCAVIAPKSDVLTLIAPHFADRMPGENWLILDRNRRAAAVHEADKAWYLRRLTDGEYDRIVSRERDGEEYASLWRVFFHAVAVGQRENPRCQRNFLPLRFRENMTEFHEE